MFEIEIGRLTRLSKVEKRKLREKITRVGLPVLFMENLKAKTFITFLMIIEDKLGDVFEVLLDGWSFRKSYLV